MEVLDLYARQSGQMGASMQMKKRKRSINQKRWGGILSGILLFILCLSGCVNSTDGDGTDHTVYMAEAREVDFSGINTNLMDAHDGVLYTTLNRSSEDSQGASYLLQWNITEDKRTEIPLFELRPGEQINGLTVEEDGTFWLLTGLMNESESSFYLYEVSKEGNKLSETDMTQQMTADGGIVSVQRMISDHRDTLYIAMLTEAYDTAILTADRTGAVKNRMVLPGSNQIVCTEDGTVYLATQLGMSVIIKQYDTDSQTTGAEIRLSGISDAMSFSLAAGGSTGLLYSDIGGIYECDPETGECVKKVDWLDCDVAAVGIRNFGQAGDGQFWALNMPYSPQGFLEEWMIIRQAADGQPQKEILTFGTPSANAYNLLPAIVTFNKTNPDYRIQVTAYGSVDDTEAEWTEDQLQAGINRMYSDLAGGNGPDIIDVASINYRQLIDSGILEDIKPFLDSDSTIKREDYFENVLNAYEVNGGLYGLTIDYAIRALAGDAEQLTGMEQWTMEEMADFAGQYPDQQLFSLDPDSLLAVLLYVQLDRFMDWDTGTCSFEKEEFYKILEFVNSYEYDAAADMEGALLSQEWIFDLLSIQYAQQKHNGNVQFIGFPAAEGSGIIMTTGSSVGMNADSDHKEGVWAFMNFLLSYEHQRDVSMIPANRIAFEERFRGEMEEAAETAQFYYDSAGAWGGVPYTGQDLETLYELAEKVQLPAGYDNQVFSLISEEAAGYFAGQKTVEETAALIQNRVQLYMDETDES